MDTRDLRGLITNKSFDKFQPDILLKWKDMTGTKLGRVSDISGNLL